MIIGRFDKWGRGCSGVQDGGQTKRVPRYRNEITHWLSTSWQVNKSLSLSRPADLLAAVSMMRVLFLEIDLHSSVKTKKSCGKGREKNVGKMEKFNGIMVSADLPERCLLIRFKLRLFFFNFYAPRSRLATSALCGAEIRVQIDATSTTTRTTSPVGLRKGLAPHTTGRNRELLRESHFVTKT